MLDFIHVNHQRINIDVSVLDLSIKDQMAILHKGRDFSTWGATARMQTILFLSALVHLLANPASTPGPFSRNLSLQFDNASNNKCSLAVSFFGYLISEDIFHDVRVLNVILMAKI